MASSALASLSVFCSSATDSVCPTNLHSFSNLRRTLCWLDVKTAAVSVMIATHSTTHTQIARRTGKAAASALRTRGICEPPSWDRTPRKNGRTRSPPPFCPFLRYAHQDFELRVLNSLGTPTADRELFLAQLGRDPPAKFSDWSSASRRKNDDICRGVMETARH
jgi:hypothetical protein